MRKSILMMLLAVVSSSAAAVEWVRVERNETTDIYADPATIRRRGDMVKIWILFDHKTPKVFVDKPYRSFMEQDEFDCDEERERQLAGSYHSGNMAEGDVVYTNSNPGKWSPVAPGTVGEILWKIGCGKR
jgi:surface-adhesin protein E